MSAAKESPVKTFGVTLKIIGTMYLEVEAVDEDSAVAAAMDQCTSDDFESWEPISGEAEE